MTEQDRPFFAKALGSAGIAFREELTEKTFKTYFVYLKDLSIEALAYALDRIIITEPKFPTVHKIREYAATYRPPIIQDLKTPAVNYTGTPVPKEKLARFRKALQTGTLSEFFEAEGKDFAGQD